MNGSLNDMLNDEFVLGGFLHPTAAKALFNWHWCAPLFSLIHPHTNGSNLWRDEKDKVRLEERSWRRVSGLQFSIEGPVVGPCFRESWLGFSFTLFFLSNRSQVLSCLAGALTSFGFVSIERPMCFEFKLKLCLPEGTTDDNGILTILSAKIQSGKWNSFRQTAGRN